MSIIVPAYNERPFLERLLDSVAKLHHPDALRWELIVVDNNSSPPLGGVVRDFADRLRGSLRYCFERVPGKCHALNRALTEASGRLVSFLDHDAVVDSQYVTAIQRRLEAYGAHVFGGRVVPVWPTSPPRWIARKGAIVSSWGPIVAHDYGDDPRPYGPDMKLPLGCNFACPRALFDRYGTFNVELGPRPGNHMGGEESDLLRRFIAGGERMLYAPDVIVYHPVAVKRMTKRYFRYRLFCAGRAARRMASYQATFPSIFGAPRFLLRGLVIASLRYVIAMTLGRFSEAFEHELDVCEYAGAIYESRRLVNAHRC